MRGDSMAPTLLDGDYVVGRRPSRRRPIQVGDVIVLRHSRYGRMVKRVFKRDEHGVVHVRGDNATSVAMIDVGPIQREQILRRVAYRISKTGLERISNTAPR